MLSKMSATFASLLRRLSSFAFNAPGSCFLFFLARAEHLTPAHHEVLLLSQCPRSRPSPVIWKRRGEPRWRLAAGGLARGGATARRASRVLSCSIGLKVANNKWYHKTLLI